MKILFRVALAAIGVAVIASFFIGSDQTPDAPAAPSPESGSTAPPPLCHDADSAAYSEGAMVEMDGAISRCESGEWVAVNSP